MYILYSSSRDLVHNDLRVGVFQPDHIRHNEQTVPKSVQDRSTIRMLRNGEGTSARAAVHLETSTPSR